MKINTLPISLALLALALIILAFVFGDGAPDTSQQDLHCEMVQIWNETNGEFGWPDYNNTAGSCPQEK
jgi:hypothetical protein